MTEKFRFLKILWSHLEIDAYCKMRIAAFNSALRQYHRCPKKTRSWRRRKRCALSSGKVWVGYISRGHNQNVCCRHISGGYIQHVTQQRLHFNWYLNLMIFFYAGTVACSALLWEQWKTVGILCFQALLNSYSAYHSSQCLSRHLRRRWRDPCTLSGYPLKFFNNFTH